MGFLIHREIAGNVEELFNISGSLVAVVIRLKMRHRLRIAQVYAPTISYDDEAIDSGYEDVESTMKKAMTQLGWEAFTQIWVRSTWRGASGKLDNQKS